jgi:MinD-like ATPase involved in chromosome partitioning or flagellar assembly
MASAKGGSGKTILTATFATFLANLGKKVLMIDTDAATNGLTLFYIKEVRLQAEVEAGMNRRSVGVYEQGSHGLPPTKIELGEGLQLIPATFSFQNTEEVDIARYQLSLQHMMHDLRDLYDYIFLDAQAGSDPYAQISMSKGISDEVVIVSEYDPMSAAGVERLKALFPGELSYVRTWVLLNKMLPDFVKSFSDFMEVAKYLSPIPWDADVVRAYARRRLALNLETGNEYTLAVRQTLATLLGEQLADDMKKWAKEREAALRHPIVEQIRDTEKELEGLLMEVNWQERRKERRRLFTEITSLTAALASSIILLTWLKPFDSMSPVYRGVVLGMLGAGVGVVATVFFRLARLLTPLGYKESVERAALRRRQEVLEERLKKLDALKDADLQTLLKTKL